MGLMCPSCERSTSTESGLGFVITSSILRPSALSDPSEVGAGRFRQFNPLISCRQRCLQGVSKKERLTRRSLRFRLQSLSPFNPSTGCGSRRRP